jgi:hypothetical protein
VLPNTLSAAGCVVIASFVVLLRPPAHRKTGSAHRLVDLSPDLRRFHCLAQGDFLNYPLSNF